MNLIKRILTFNADFRFLSCSNNLKIIEINSDYLSRYDVAQKVDFYPRRTRLKQISKHAIRNNAELSILYNPVFHTKFDKAQRWGIETLAELSQKKFFQANVSGIQQLAAKLRTTHHNNWVLLLSVSAIDNLYSHCIADPFINNYATQYELKILLSEFAHNTMFIGDDKTVEFISNDKFITSKILAPDYQPRSTLILNGVNANAMNQYLPDTLQTEDIIIKPLNKHSGIGIFRTKNLRDLRKILSDMHEANMQSEVHKLNLTLNLQNPHHYLLQSRQNEPFLQCQAYAPSDTIDNREITYRAVITAYIDSHNNVEIDIECIYPKKSAIGDYKSDVVNLISKAELYNSMNNSLIRQNINLVLKDFINKLIAYNHEKMLATLCSESDAHFVKGLHFFHANLSTQCILSKEHIERAKSIINQLFLHNPQCFYNCFKIFSDLHLLPFKTNSKQLIHFSSHINAKKIPLDTDIVCKNITIISRSQRYLLSVGKKNVNNHEIALLQFVTICQSIKNIITNPQYSLTDFMFSNHLYHLISLLKTFAQKLIKKSYVSQLTVVINFFELRSIVNITNISLQSLFTLDIKSKNLIIHLFQLSNNESFTDVDHIIIAKALIILSHLSPEAIKLFPQTINNYSLADYLIKLTNILQMRFAQKNTDCIDSYSLLFKVFSLWCNHHSFGLSTEIQSSWLLRSQAIMLLELGMSEIQRTNQLSLNSIIIFINQQIIKNSDAHTVESGLTIFNILSKQQTNNNFKLFKSKHATITNTCNHKKTENKLTPLAFSK